MLLAISIVTSTLWRYVAAHRELLEPDVTDEEVTAITLATTPNIGFYVAVVLLALVAPQVAAFGYLLVAVDRRVPPARRRQPSGHVSRTWRRAPDAVRSRGVRVQEATASRILTWWPT